MSRRHVIVLVALALVGIGAGLLVTGVHRVREAAARMTCACHFCQLGVALHNHAGANPSGRGLKKPETLPPGTVPNTYLPPELRLSWLVPVLPYIEQDTVFKQFDLTLGPGDPRNQVPTSNRFRHLGCPSAPDAVSVFGAPTPVTHYVGVAGVGVDAATLPLGHPRAGVFGYDRRTAFEDIADGTSNTLMLIETVNDPGHWAHGGPATVRAIMPGAAPHIGPGRSFGGSHAGLPVLFGTRSHMCNTGMADGSLKTLTNRTDPGVLEALATVAGKEIVPTNW